MRKLNLDHYKETIKELFNPKEPFNNVPVFYMGIGIASIILYIIIYGISGEGCRILLISSFLFVFMGCYISLLMKLREKKDEREAKTGSDN